ncbi:unnamed protein product [Trifolium pratense]|uniref:Uncharacterized protein n=1 Tax=Trifolium pratense TaxID=57577 RepID=A0ACB0JE11_TRIPR|nr:unnamed protein product [Trifolium pratense]
MEKGGEATIDLKRDGIEDLSGRVHLLPCCIKHDGPTEVSHYFKPKPTGVVGEGYSKVTTLPLPPNYSGFVLGKKNSSKKSGESSDSWETSATFNDITYWNHDYVPSQNDDFFRSFHWITVAKAVSSFSLYGLLRMNLSKMNIS